MKNKKAFLSIIIPTCNEESYLPTILDCIKRQTYRNYEVIVADGNSKDKTVELAKCNGCRVIKEPKIGRGNPGRGRNLGAKIAKGDILLFLDADVKIGKDFLENALKELKDRNLQVSGCYVNTDTKNVFDGFVHKILNGWFFLMQFIYPHMVGHCIFSTKRIHNKLHGFDQTILFAEDMDYVNRSKKFCRFRILRSVRIIASTRRFENENRFVLILKYLLCPFYRMIFGEIRTNVFNYKSRSLEANKSN